MGNRVYILVLNISGLLLTVQALGRVLTVNLENLFEFLDHAWHLFTVGFYAIKKLNQILHGVLLSVA